MKFKKDENGEFLLDEEGNKIPEESNEDEPENKSSRANERIRDLANKNKDLKETNKELKDKIGSLEEKINSLFEKLENPKNDNKKVNDETGVDIRLKKVEANQLEDTKKNFLNSGVVTEEMLEGIDSQEQLNLVVKIASLVNKNIETKVEEEAKKKAKVLIDQAKNEQNGEKKKQDDKANALKESLKKLNLL